jgi:hypothetical protein
MCYFNNREPKDAKIITKKCSTCYAEHFLSYSEIVNSSSTGNLVFLQVNFGNIFEKPSDLDPIRKVFESVIDNKFISLSEVSIFEISLLDSFTSQLLFNHSTFQGFTSAFNYLYKTKQSYIINKERKVLMESRLTEVWLYYRTLLFHFELHKTFKNFDLVYLKSLDKNIHSLKKMMLPHFIKKWSGKIIFSKNIFFSGYLLIII